ISNTGYFGGTVDYYEQTNHIPPYTSAIYYPGGAGGTAANYFFAARGFCAIPSGSTTLPAGCTLNGDGTISYVNPAPPTLTTLIRNSNLAFNLGYSYNDLYMQSYICFRNTGYGIAPYAPCAFFGGTKAITLGAISFYSNQQHF